MPEEGYAAIALGAAIVVGKSTYKRLRTNGNRKHKFIEKAKAEGYYTTGIYESSKVILGVENSSNVKHRDDSLKCKYRYQVNGITYYKYITFQSTGRVGTDFPTKVTVYYNPKNPKKAVCPEEATIGHKVRHAVYSAIFVGFLTAFLCFHLLRFLFK